MVWRAFILFMFAAGPAVGPVCADSLILKNGDILSGQLARINKGALFFRADIGGAMMVPVDQVRSLTTDAAFEVRLTNSKRLTGRFVSREEKICLEDPVDGRLHIIELRQVAEIRAVPEPDAPNDSTAPADEEAKWSGEVSLGARSHLTNDEHTSPTLGLDIEHSGPHLRFESRVLADLDGEQGFPRFGRLDAAWDIAPLEPVFPLIEIAAERDAAAALDLRTTVAASVGRRFHDNPDRRMSGALGIEYDTAGYDAEYLDYDWVSPHSLGLRDGYEREHDLNLRIQLRYSQRIVANGDVDMLLLVRPSLTDLGDLSARSASSVKFPIGDALQLKLELMLDYEDDLPYAPLDRWRTSVGASVGWRF